MIRVAIALWLAHRMDKLLANDRFAGRWHFFLAVLAAWKAADDAAEAFFHVWGWRRHKRALKGGPPAPCQH